MTKTDPCYKLEQASNVPAAPVLKQVFDWYVRESISDEQVHRILEPILQMIREGRFDRPKVSFYLWLTRMFTSVAILALAAVALAFIQR